MSWAKQPIDTLPSMRETVARMLEDRAKDALASRGSTAVLYTINGQEHVTTDLDIAYTGAATLRWCDEWEAQRRESYFPGRPWWNG